MLSMVGADVLPNRGPGQVTAQQLVPLLEWFQESFMCLPPAVPDAGESFEPVR